MSVAADNVVGMVEPHLFEPWMHSQLQIFNKHHIYTISMMKYKLYFTIMGKNQATIQQPSHAKSFQTKMLSNALL